MPSVKTRVALTGGKYLVTHPRSRITKFVVRFAMRKLTKKAVTASHYESIPEVRGSRLITVGSAAGVVVVAGGIVLAVRKTSKKDDSAVVVPLTNAPFPAASAPPETRDAPSVAPTSTPAAEAAAEDVGDGDDAIVARVQTQLFGGAPPVGVSIEAVAGVVTLRGKVADEEAEGLLVRDAEKIEGVKAVQSELQTTSAEPDAS